jgi:hypothetical protein
MTKAEKEKHDAEVSKSHATVQDLEDERRHRRRSTWVGSAAILVTALFSLASCSVTSNEIRTMDRIATQQQARERDQLRLRCGEQMAEVIKPFFTVVLTLHSPESSGNPPGASADPASMVGLGSDLVKLAAVCSAAGVTHDVERDRFQNALAGVMSASVEPSEKQVAAMSEMQAALGSYIEIDIVGMGTVFETETGNGDTIE